MHSEQAENPLFFQLLDSCCQKIAEAVGDKQISEWTNSDYVRLSGLFQRKTKVQLSESTLKRIFGKSKMPTRYYPQKATRDALAQFIGCRDWYEFELRNMVSIEKNTAKVFPATPALAVSAAKKGLPPARWLFLSALLVCVAFIAFVLFQASPSVIEQPAYQVKLTCLNPEGQTPHSALFKLKSKGALPDSLELFTINFGDIRYKTANFKDSLLSHYYEVPGRYYPILYYKKKPLDTGYVYLQSKGWTATASVQNDTTRVYPILGHDFKVNKIFKVSAQNALHAGVDTNRTFFITFANVKPSQISGDNFELSGNFVSSPVRAGVRCSQVDIFIFGEKDRHSLGIIKPECSAWTFYQFSEHSKQGQKHDLRPLGHDLSKGGYVQLRVQDKKVSLMIDGTEVFKTSYSNAIGKIMGVKINFAGIGQFEQFKLSDLTTKEEF